MASPEMACHCTTWSSLDLFNIVDVQGSTRASGSQQGLLRPRFEIGTVSIHQIMLSKVCSKTSPNSNRGKIDSSF